MQKPSGPGEAPLKLAVFVKLVLVDGRKTCLVAKACCCGHASDAVLVLWVSLPTRCGAGESLNPLG